MPDSLRIKDMVFEVDEQLAASLKRRMHDSNVRVVEGDGSNMPFAGDSFSAVVSLTMLHHVPSPTIQDLLIGEAFRVLQPGGCLAGTDSTWSVLFQLLHVADTMTMVDPDSLVTRLEAAGFSRVAVDRGKGRFRFRAYKPVNAKYVGIEN